MKYRPLYFLFLFLFLGAFGCQAEHNLSQPTGTTAPESTSSASASATSPVTADEPFATKIPSETSFDLDSVLLFLNSGGRVDWSPDGTLIAYDALDPQGFSQTRLVSIDGLHSTCLTCGNPAAPTPFHLGNPAWHPLMKWLVVQGVPQAYFENFPIGDDLYKQSITGVGAGIGNELWVMSVDGKLFYQLTDTWGEAGLAGGVLHPHFSHLGRKLAWSQRVANNSQYPLGDWVIKVADFVTAGSSPHLENIQTFQPGTGPQRFYETHSFSPDDRYLLYTSNADGQTEYGFDIYILEIETGNSKRLTFTPNDWDEHAHYSPDGKKIAWISSLNTGTSAGNLKTEVWFMQSNGAEQHQVTFFNDPGSAMGTPTPFGLVPADLSWAPDGRQIMLEIDQNQGIENSYNIPAHLVILKLR